METPFISLFFASNEPYGKNSVKFNNILLMINVNYFPNPAVLIIIKDQLLLQITE